MLLMRQHRWPLPRPLSRPLSRMLQPPRCRRRRSRNCNRFPRVSLARVFNLVANWLVGLRVMLVSLRVIWGTARRLGLWTPRLMLLVWLMLGRVRRCATLMRVVMSRVNSLPG